MTINHPNFFIIGVPNAGTTSLWYLLKQHPEVFMSEVKEPRFFSRNNYQNYFPWYKSLFRNVTTEKAVGESSINYCETHLFESVPERIHQFNPAAKLIYVVRDPVSRVNSCWRQALSTGHWYKYFYHSKRMEKTFEKAIFEYPHFFKTTQYYNNLSSFKKYFNKRQIKVIFFEDFKENTLDTVQDIFTFLEVDSTFVPKDIDKPRNVGVSKKMTHQSIIRVADIVFKLPLSRDNQALIINRIANYYPKTKLIEPQWTYSLKIKFIDKLKEDAEKILEYGNKSKTFWDLE